MRRSEKIFTPQRTTSKTAAGDRGKLGKGFFVCNEANGDKLIDGLDGCGGEFLELGFLAMNWLWKEKSTMAVLGMLRDTRIGWGASAPGEDHRKRG